MAWRFVKEETVVLEGEPSYCHVFDRAICELPGVCKNGAWLFYNWALWSVPDRTGIGLALEVAKGFAGRLSLAIRPFDDFAELRMFEPVVSERFVSPVWVLFHNGNVQWHHAGLLDASAVTAKVDRVI